MTDFLQNFHFLRPWLLLFLLVPLCFYFKKIKFSALSSWENICDPILLNFLLVNKQNAKQTSFMRYVYIGLIGATIAAAGPCWKKDEIPTFAIENPNMFVISLSQEMQLKDIPPSRLDRTKFMLSDLIGGITDGQFGIEVYSNEPYVITPFTDDIQLIKNLLPQIAPDIVPDQGDRPDRAISLAIERFKTAGYSSGNIILFASDVGQRFDLALEKAEYAAANNYKIHVIDTSYSGNEKLKLLAEKSRGIYMNVQEISLDNILKDINNLNQKQMTLSENLRSNYIDFGYYLVFIPLLCLLFFFRKGLLIFFFCIYSATTAHAGIFQNANQEGLSFFQNGQYDEALQKFTDSGWRGVTLYKQEKYEEALKEFDKQKNEESLYNKGVVLVKLCQYEDALKTFNLVLEKNPHHDDALYNQQVLLSLFEEAKKDPSVLDCNNQQQNNNQNQQNQEQNNDSSSNNDHNNDDNSEQNNQQNDTEQNNSDSENTQQQQNSEQQKDSNDKQNSSAENHETGEKSASPEQEQTANNGDEQQNNQQGEQKEQEVSPASAKQGENNDKHDEEALAMQRQYREIPEDPGGLLRAFIKKEYMKDRYKDEDM